MLRRRIHDVWSNREEIPGHCSINAACRFSIIFIWMQRRTNLDLVASTNEGFILLTNVTMKSFDPHQLAHRNEAL